MIELSSLLHQSKPGSNVISKIQITNDILDVCTKQNVNSTYMDFRFKLEY